MGQASDVLQMKTYSQPALRSNMGEPWKLRHTKILIQPPRCQWKNPLNKSTLCRVTHRVVVTLQDDASGVSGRGPTQVSVLIDDADGAVLCQLGGRQDVSQVVAFTIDHTAGSQGPDWREDQNVCKNKSHKRLNRRSVQQRTWTDLDSCSREGEVCRRWCKSCAIWRSLCRWRSMGCRPRSGWGDSGRTYYREDLGGDREVELYCVQV